VINASDTSKIEKTDANIAIMKKGVTAVMVGRTMPAANNNFSTNGFTLRVLYRNKMLTHRLVLARSILTAWLKKLH
jgi:hypothetical protein